MEIVETRELADDRAFIEGRPPTMLYVLSEAPEGHGALPNPKYVEPDVIRVSFAYFGEETPHWVKWKYRTYRKEKRRYMAMRKSGQLEVWEYLVWVPW